jgi:uncharacterized protein YgiM (DUF1202 family)
LVDALTLPHCAHGTAIATAERQNVREQPHTSAEILGQLLKGQTVTVWALDQGWMIVQIDDGLTGWAAAEYLRVVGTLAP